MVIKSRPRRVYFDIKKKTPYIVKNGKRVFIRLKRDGGGNTTIDHRTIKDKRQIVKVIVNTTRPHEVKSKPRRKRRIILAKKEERTTKAGNERTIYVPQYMPFPGHSSQPITFNVREGGQDKEKSVVPTSVNLRAPKEETKEESKEESKGERPKASILESLLQSRKASENVETKPSVPYQRATKTEVVLTPEQIKEQQKAKNISNLGAELKAKLKSMNEQKTATESTPKGKARGAPTATERIMDKYNPNNYNINEDLEDKKRILEIFEAYNIADPGRGYGPIKLLEQLRNYTELQNKTGTEIMNHVLEYQESKKATNIPMAEPLNIPTDIPLAESAIELEKQVGEGNGECSISRPLSKGLTTKEINKLMKDEGYDIVKAIPSDCIPELVNDVNKKTERFGFIINNEPHTKAGEHWRSCFIDIPEGNVCWFDSLCGEPTRKEMKGIKVLIDKINPEYYLKFKINRIKLQGDTANCGWFCCKFIDDMMNGKKFKEATGWDVVNGECGVENYKEKHGCNPERWGCI
jgi:hypothetical protein